MYECKVEASVKDICQGKNSLFLTQHIMLEGLFSPTQQNKKRQWTGLSF